MNISAVYHIADGNYCFPLDENRLMIRLKTGYDVDSVTLVWGDPFAFGIFGGDPSWRGDEQQMTHSMNVRSHKVWETVVEPKFKRCRYYFILRSGDETIYCIESGFETPERFAGYKGRRQDFYFPWMNPADIIKPADWVNETVWYQIFPDRFCNSGRNTAENIGKRFCEWASPDTKVHNGQIYGGDLKGVESRLDYLKDLGVTGLYFTPINQSKSTHKYDTTDYNRVDPQFGDTDDIKELVKAAHARGIRVMLDGVFNHSGTEFFAWKDVVEKGRDSKYFDWFMVNKVPFEVTMKAAKNGDFFAFAFSDHMPKLNTNNDEVIEYFIEVCRRWVTEYDIDALRLDVANETSHKFNKRLRQALFALKPDFYICGELWHNSLPWLRGDEFDAVMNYSLQETIESFWRNEDFTATDFEYGINDVLSSYAQQTSNVMFNLLDSHDTMRLITRCGGDVDAFYQELCALFTLNGSLCFYYGTEVRLEGGHDPDCRRCMPWKEIDNGDYDDRIAEMKKLIAMRKSVPQLRNGSLRFVGSGSDRVIVYEKYDDEKTYRIILNCSNSDCDAGEYASAVYSRGLDGSTLSHGGLAVLEMI